MIAVNSAQPAASDADLVRASLAHDRAAFQEIIARYQALVCALAYSATGSFSRSEDLAQDTFVTAWKELTKLREPARLRAWICGIARNLIREAQRRAGREPAQMGEPLDAALGLAAAEPSPPEQAISREEEAILWRALARIPEGYREPLVLYYREQQSVARVAAALDLTEDAVKQRLARGRLRLQERVQAFVEGALERSNPGPEFTAGVLAALPFLAAAPAATATTGAVQGGTGTKIALWLRALATLLTAQVLWFVSSVSFFAVVGGYIGWQMGDPAQNDHERAWCGRFWRLFFAGMFGCVLPLTFLPKSIGLHPRIFQALQVWLVLFYAGLGAVLVTWAWQNHRRIRRPGAGGARPRTAATRRSLVWVTLGTIGMGGLLARGFATAPWVTKIALAEVSRMVAAHPEAACTVRQFADGGNWAEIAVSDGRRITRYYGPLGDAALAALRETGKRVRFEVQGRDFDVLGWPGRRLGMLAIIVAAAGGVMLFRTARAGSVEPTFTSG